MFSMNLKLLFKVGIDFIFDLVFWITHCSSFANIEYAQNKGWLNSHSEISKIFDNNVLFFSSASAHPSIASSKQKAPPWMGPFLPRPITWIRFERRIIRVLWNPIWPPGPIIIVCKWSVLSGRRRLFPTDKINDFFYSSLFWHNCTFPPANHLFYYYYYPL